MKKNIFASILLLAVLSFGFLSVVQHGEIQELKAQLLAYEVEDQTSEVPVDDEPVVLDKQSGTAVAVEEAPEPVLVVAEVAAIEEPLNEEEVDSERRRKMRDFSTMMDNPTYNKMVVAGQRATLDVLYDDLIDYLILDEEEEGYLMDLLVSRQMKQVELAMSVMQGGLTEEERVIAGSEIKVFAEEVREEIKYFLNDKDDIAEWEFYEKTLEERMAISGVEENLKKSGLALMEGEGRQLIELMSREKEAFSFQSDLFDQENMEMSAERFSGDNLAAFETDMVNLDTKISDGAQSILTAEQLSVFLESQAQMREMKLAQVRMAANMFSKSDS